MITNSADIAAELQLVCEGGHEHEALMGGCAAKAAEYPPALCQAIIRGLRKHLQRRNLQPKPAEEFITVLASERQDVEEEDSIEDADLEDQEEEEQEVARVEEAGEVEAAAFVEERLKVVELTAARKKQRQEEITEEERSRVRSVCGALNWIGREGRPDAAAAASMFSSLMSTMKIEDVLELNKAVEQLKYFELACMELSRAPQDGKTTQLAAKDGTVSLQVNSIDKRSSKTVWIIPARSWEIELGAMTVCVSEVDSDSSIRAICHCSASGRESFAFPSHATASGFDRLDSRICAAALQDGGVSPGPIAPLATTKEAPQTSPTTSLQLDSRTHALQGGKVDAFLIQGNVVRLLVLSIV
eukprot:s4146_g5.t1